MKSKLICAAVLVALIVISFYTYRSGVISVPRSDHYGFMAEREYAVSDTEFLLKQLVYNRTRVIAKGDSFLFRPGMTGTLALLDIFFRHNLYALGAFSILAHALTAFSLFLLLSLFLRRSFAFILSVVFATHLAGFEMVFWRHISPYMFCLVFVGLALYALGRWLQPPENRNWLLLFSFCLFLSSLFHEVVLPAMVIFCLLFLVLHFQNQSTNPSYFKSLSIACLVPLAANLLLNVAGRIAFSSQANLLLSDAAQPASVAYASKFLSHAVYVGGLIITAFLAPSIIRFSFINLDFRAEWDFLKIPAPVFYTAGFIFLTLIAGALIYLYIFRKKLGQRQLFPIFAFAGIFLIVTFLGLTVGRAIPRSIGYLKNSTYYFYLTNYALTIIVAMGLRKISSLPYKNLKIGLVFFLLCVAGYQIKSGIAGIEKAINARGDYDKQIASKTLRVWSELSKHPEYCYGGTGAERVSSFVPNVLLYRRSCNAFPDKIPLYLLENEKRELWFMQLIPEQIDQQAYRYGQINNEGQAEFSAQSTDNQLSFSGFSLSNAVHHPIYYGARLHGGFVGGLVFNYHDPANFSILVANERYTYVQFNENGNPSEPSYVAQQILDPIAFDLSIRRIGGRYVVFYNRTLLAVINDAVSEGRVGLYRKPRHSAGEYFTDVVLIDASEAKQSQMGAFEPVFQFQF